MCTFWGIFVIVGVSAMDLLPMVLLSVPSAEDLGAGEYNVEIFFDAQEELMTDDDLDDDDDDDEHSLNGDENERYVSRMNTVIGLLSC